MRMNGAKTALFHRFFVSYLLILLVPLLLAGLAYRAAVTVIEKNTIDSGLALLQKTREIADKYFQEIDELTFRFNSNPKLVKLLALPPLGPASPDIFYIWDYARDLPYQTITNNIFKSSFLIFLKNSGYILSHNNTYNDFQRFYRDSFHYAAMDYQTWYARYFNQYHHNTFLPAQPIYFNGSKRSAITYLHSLPTVKGVKPQGVLAFYIDEAQIGKLFSDLCVLCAKSGGRITLSDQAGQALARFPLQTSTNSDYPFTRKNGYEHRRVHGVDMLLIHITSLYNGLTYTAALPYRAIMAKVNYIKQLTIVLGLVAVGAGLLLSWLLAYRNSQPFREMLTVLKEFFQNANQLPVADRHDEYAFLKGGIFQLINSTTDLRAIVARQTASLKTLFMDRLLKGEFDDRQKMTILLSHNDLEIPGEQFAVLVMRINSQEQLVSSAILKELELFRVVLEDTLQKKLQGHGYFHPLNENDIAILLSFSDSACQTAADYIQQIVQQMSAAIAAQYQLIPLFGIGAVYDDLFAVHYSFREAVQALEFYRYHQTGTAQTIIWYEQLPKETLFYYYPPELELKLIQLTKAGNWVTVEALLEKLWNENFSARNIGDNYCQYLFLEMKATLMKLMTEINSHSDTIRLDRELKMETDYHKTFAVIKTAYMTLCQSVARRQKSHNQLLREQIISYINAHFNDCNLSLVKLATEFNLSESYFSQFFKEQTGQTFSGYLENFRIQYACKLLFEQNLSIEAVAARSGYNTPNAFRRAFKRVMGVTPSSYQTAAASKRSISTS